MDVFDRFGLTFSRPQLTEMRSQFSEMRISDLISERCFEDKISHIYEVHKYSVGKNQQFRMILVMLYLVE